MTKPEDIPQDVWDAAMGHFEAADWPLWLDGGEWSLALISLSHAIMAERESGERERVRMAEDWCDFCEAIGVDVDTHDAVAAQIKAAFAP